tara:strand:- start:184 stop:489 length:306 start_codon:yes stop_codon:yes gene_type:complete
LQGIKIPQTVASLPQKTREHLDEVIASMTGTVPHLVQVAYHAASKRVSVHEALAFYISSVDNRYNGNGMKRPERLSQSYDDTIAYINSKANGFSDLGECCR